MDRLLNTGGSAHIHGIINEGSARQFHGENNRDTRKPAAANLFRIKDDNKQDLLGEKQDQAFHHAVAKLLFNGIRFRKDAQTAIAFLTTRVRNPAEDN